MRKVLLAVFLLIPYFTNASHIVGGEFELLYSNGFYRLNLILYFDRIHGNPDAKDSQAIVSIYRKSDNAFMRDITLNLQSEIDVVFTQPSCTNTRIKTTKLTYSSLLELPSSLFNDQKGYYMSWQRCCRNADISNIFSVDINQDPGTSLYGGQTFYLEFPAVTKDGALFINSSPKLFSPLSDYACPFRPYYVDFSGIDDDRDSLVYSLVTPLNTKSGSPLPTAAPLPYPDIIWKPTYSLSNLMNGLPDLRISSSGLLTCTPTIQGLFAFAVKVEEFRNKKKIGETRRDYQLLVDVCPPAFSPKITGKNLTDADFTYENTLTARFSNTVMDKDRCIQVRVSDLDSTMPDQNFTENVGLRVVGINLKNPNLNKILPDISTAVLKNGSTADFLICFPQCPYIKEGPYQLGIIAFDDACSLPLTDTLWVKVDVQIPGSNNPAIDTDITDNPNERKVSIQREVLESVRFKLTGQDLIDNDFLVLNGKGVGFNLSDYAISFPQITGNGLISTDFIWNILCDKIDLKKKDNYKFQFIVIDNANKCLFYKADTVDIEVKLSLPHNAKPQLSAFTSSLQSVANTSLEYVLGQPIEVNLLGTDSDVLPSDRLTLSLIEAKGDLEPQGYTFQKVGGATPVQSILSWIPDCSIFKNQVYDNNYEFKFRLADDRCMTAKADTISLNLKIRDVDGSDRKFYMPNVFTPNGDNRNDYFALEGIDSEGNEDLNEKVSLPKDNCTDHFESIKIFNRWGMQVFESTDRKFRWYAPNEAAGVYYYKLKYANREFKSPLSIK
jgi:CHU_C Type IX secretion signal domain